MSATSTVNDLLQTLEDGKEGFAKAARTILDPEVKPLLQAYSAERAEMIEELLAVAPPHAEDPNSTLVGSLHRGWINFIGALASGDDHAILAECERGEDHAVAVVTKALKADLQADLRQVVESFSVRIHAVHNAVKELRDAPKV